MTPVPLVDDKGHAVLTPQGRQILRPAGMDPHFFVAQGLKDFETRGAVLGSGSLTGELVFELGALLNFDRGKPWDAQRVGGELNEKFVDYATIVIELYAAASGLSRNEILQFENIIAKDSHYCSDVELDKTYTHLPVRNVVNTDLGHSLYQSGRIGAGKPTQ